jgi:ankyrin repeat protein
VNQADIDGRSPLYIASCCGHASVCDLLLSCGADLNQTVNGMNSLSIAFQQGHGSVCDLLLSHGAGGPTCQE